MLNRNSFGTKRNLKRAINLTGKSIHANGGFSSYYLLNTTQGIKVLYSDGYQTIKSLRNSQVWRRATKENSMIRNCRKRYKNIPIAYGVFPIKIGNSFYPGIVMQHIYGRTIRDIYLGEVDKQEVIIKRIKKELVRRKIYHDDLYGRNIIKNDTNNEYYVIDFTEGYVGLDDGYPDCHN